MLLGLFKRDVKTVQLELIRSGITFIHTFIHSRLRDYYDELLILVLWYTLHVFELSTQNHQRKKVLFIIYLARFFVLGTIIKI